MVNMLTSLLGYIGTSHFPPSLLVVRGVNWGEHVKAEASHPDQGVWQPYDCVKDWCSWIFGGKWPTGHRLIFWATRAGAWYAIVSGIFYRSTRTGMWSATGKQATSKKGHRNKRKSSSNDNLNQDLSTMCIWNKCLKHRKKTVLILPSLNRN